uniref:Endochitinase 2 ) n=1 Tax=Ganoderma boninense TaxID=34458 RepID=A0A5K1K508_9APHY|nr:Endochitinase 2 (EC (Chitinase 2) [Ganoderma boninense]
MPTNENTGEQYDITSRGTNEWGNNWDHRVSENGDHGYHYSNKDGSYYYQNFDGSRYYNDGKGYSRHTSSGGNVTENHGQ